jgi:hypothetical protein
MAIKSQNHVVRLLFDSSSYFSMTQLNSFQLDAMYEAFTAMSIQVLVFWIVTPCGDVLGYQRFGGPSCLLLQD